MTFVLDTNIIAYFLNNDVSVVRNIELLLGDRFYLPQ